MLNSAGHKETVRIKSRFTSSMRPKFHNIFLTSRVNKHDYIFASIMQRLYTSVSSVLDIGVI